MAPIVGGLHHPRHLGGIVAPELQSVAVHARPVAVDRAPSSSQTGLIQVNVASEMATPGKSFSFEMDPHVVARSSVDTPVKMSQMNGQPLPSWLRYDSNTKTFTATDVPPGAFPLQVKVTVGNTDSVMVIQEKPSK